MLFRSALACYGQPQPGSPAQVQAYVADVRKELNDPRVHAYSHHRRVFAQKPLEEQKLAFWVNCTLEAEIKLLLSSLNAVSNPVVCTKYAWLSRHLLRPDGGVILDRSKRDPS